MGLSILCRAHYRKKTFINTPRWHTLSIFGYNPFMKKIFILLTLIFQILFAATPEQVEHYISVSSSEEQLIELEKQFTQMQNSINRMKSDASAEDSAYDMQLLSIRFREYLQKNISEDEMDEILSKYRSVVLLKFVSVQNDEAYDEEEAQKYMKALEVEDNASVRMELLEKISTQLYKKENIGILFDNLMIPLLQNSKGASQIDDKTIDKNRKAYVKRMLESGKVETAYSTREFTIEELEALLEIVESPAIDHESKAVFGATAYALKEFFLSMAKRYDPSKHKR